MLRPIEANIPLRPFDPVSVPSDIDCREPANVHGTNPADKGVVLDTLWVVSPANRAEQSSPRLEIQK
jgi:hypothetical protein